MKETKLTYFEFLLKNHYILFLMIFGTLFGIILFNFEGWNDLGFYVGICISLGGIIGILVGGFYLHWKEYLKKIDKK